MVHRISLNAGRLCLTRNITNITIAGDTYCNIVAVAAFEYFTEYMKVSWTVVLPNIERNTIPIKLLRSLNIEKKFFYPL